MHLKYLSTSKALALTARKPRVRRSRVLHKPNVNISRPHTLTPQSLVAVTHYVLTAAHIAYQKVLKQELSLSAPENWTHDRTYVVSVGWCLNQLN